MFTVWLGLALEDARVEVKEGFGLLRELLLKAIVQ
jgi:hypothetical protein